VSSVTATCVAVADRVSAVEVLMPSVQQVLLVLLDDHLDLVITPSPEGDGFLGKGDLR
jgi:hypothetical protein